MPNWTDNSLKVKGAPERVKDFMEKFKTKGFEAFFPTPEILFKVDQNEVDKFLKRIFEIGSMHFAANPTLKKEKNFSEKIETYEPKNEKEKQIIEVLKTGYTGWYDFAVSEWGTKWNIDINCSEFFENTASFWTAWDPPIPFVQKVSKLYPELEFSLWWRNDGENKAKELTFKDGKTIKHNQFFIVTTEDIDFYEEDEEQLSSLILEAKEILNKGGTAIIDEEEFPPEKMDEALKKLKELISEEINTK